MNESLPTTFVPNGDKRAAELADQFVPLSAIHAKLDARYLVKGWFDKGAASVIYGESNVGKTFFALDLALHVAAGTEWNGHRVGGGHAVYVACEGGGGLNNRIAAVQMKNPELIARAIGKFILLPAPLDLHGDLDAQALIAALRGLGDTPALVVIDTLARAMGEGDENVAKDMGKFVQSVDAIRLATGAHVAIIHHSGKDASKGARGSGSLRAAVDTEIQLGRNGSAVVATATKQRDMPCGAEFAYRLVSVDLGQDTDGDPVTSAVVQGTNAPPPHAKKLPPQSAIAMQAFGDALAAHGEIRLGDDFPDNRQCVSLGHWRKACDRLQISDGKDESAPRKAFERAGKTLQERGVIRVLDGFAWRVAEN